MLAVEGVGSERAETPGVPPVDDEAEGDPRSASNEADSESGEVGLSVSSPLRTMRSNEIACFDIQPKRLLTHKPAAHSQAARCEAVLDRGTYPVGTAEISPSEQIQDALKA
jgi:hypothetical protein